MEEEINIKNIYILPTDKPSKLYKIKEKYYLEEYPDKSVNAGNHNIYITSDEEIKEGDWYLYCLIQISKRTRGNLNAEYPHPNYQKIILTTDPDLIADGVQAIEDEFLEWFVKNPSCESIKVNLNSFGECHMKGDYCGCYDTADQSLCKLYYPNYNIIIPQEEPKQETTGIDDNRPKPNNCHAIEQGLSKEGCIFPACHCGLPIKKKVKQDIIQSDEDAEIFIDNIINPAEPNEALKKAKQKFSKQQTLEDITLQLYPKKEVKLNNNLSHDINEMRRFDFSEGAKWQAERMYSEEEVIDVLFEALNHKKEECCITHTSDSIVRKVFEQFKKK